MFQQYSVEIAKNSLSDKCQRRFSKWYASKVVHRGVWDGVIALKQKRPMHPKKGSANASYPHELCTGIALPFYSPKHDIEEEEGAIIK